MTERSTERVAGSEPVDHLDLDGWHDDSLAGARPADALRAELLDRKLDA